MTYCFLLESSLTPTYQRLPVAYRVALEQQGYKTILLEHTTLPNSDAALSKLKQLIEAEEISHCLIFDCSQFFNLYLANQSQYVFELLDTSLVFLHHENVWGNLIDFKQGSDPRLLEAWRRVQKRSIHFCLEYQNFLDLRELGFEQTYTISQGSEFEPLSPPTTSLYDISFVGDVVPSLNSAIEPIHHLPHLHRVLADFWGRLVALDRNLDASAVAYASQPDQTINHPNFVVRKAAYFDALNALSPAFRGEVLQRVNSRFKVDIIGETPRDLQSSPQPQISRQSNLTDYASADDYVKVQKIYANSKINLNISSLEFDDAIADRVVDIAMVGGFVLTDWRDDLSKLTQVSEEISYKTLDELNDKLAYYLTHDAERLAVAQQLHQDVREKCNYARVIEFLVSKLSSMAQTQTEPVRVDLGCGNSKPEGFIGVDMFHGPKVDVVADLNKRFPFPDSSVDMVRAYDSIEHLHDRIHTMNEIWRICKHNAQVEIMVPSTDGRGAFQDPTHVSFWNKNSFMYYCIESPGLLNLCKQYGFKGAFRLAALEQIEGAHQIIHVHVILRAVKST